jgi:hypothetical protein
MARRGPRSDVSIDRYDDDRSYVSRGPRSRANERYREEEIEYRRAPVREREREPRETIVREEIRERERERPRVPPQFLDEDYGRTTAGPMVLRARETEDFEFAPRPRRRSPSPDPPPKVEREEIIIRTDDSDHRPAPRPRERSREREEIIIRKTEDDGRGGRDDREREEIIIRKTDDDVISRRGGRDNYEREEIIIRKDERDSDSYVPRSRYDYDARPISHERERSRVRRGSESDQEIIIRQDRDGRNGDREKQEIIIRKQSRSRSPSPSSSGYRHPAPDPPVIRRPPIHQDVYTHHHHVDHGYDTALVPRPRPISRPPSPPMPPTRESEDRIEIHRSGERNGRPYDEDIIIDHRDNDGPSRARSRSPLPPPGLLSRDGDPYYDRPPGRYPPPGYRPYYDRETREEADYLNDIAERRGYPGEAYRGSTRDWAIVDVPPGTERVRMNGAGGGEQEITWQRYNGVRRSKFYPDGDGREAGREVGRPLAPGAGGEIGGRYGRTPDPRDRLWTEITKDLVVKEAIQEMGYEFEETDDFYYIMVYLDYVSYFPVPFALIGVECTDGE